MNIDNTHKRIPSPIEWGMENKRTSTGLLSFLKNSNFSQIIEVVSETLLYQLPWLDNTKFQNI